MNQQQPQHSHCGHFNSPLSTSMHQSDQLNDIQIEETQDIQTPHSDSQNLMILVDDLRKFRVGFTAEDKSDNYIRSIDFSPDGMVALCNTENAIRFYTLNPKLPTELILTTGKYGAGIAKFFNDSSKVVHTSTKVDFGLRLSDHNSKSYERYFLGHSAEVTSLVLAKSSHNVFASASKDKSVKIWDSRQSSCVHSKSTKSHPITEFHSEDTQLAVATAVDETTFLIEFIDIRNVKDENVVSKFYLTDQDFEWTDMTFSNNGKFLMINTVDTLSIVIDPATGDMLHRLSGYCNPSKESIQTCFTPDSNFVLGGSQDGTVHIWNMQTSEKEEILRKPAVGSTRNIIFNPVFMCFATGGEMFHLWIEE